MVTRTVRKITHQLVAVSAGEVTTRCGQTFKKPKAGHGSAVAFNWTCSDCEAATEELLATLVVTT